MTEDEQREIEQTFIASWDGIERFNRKHITHFQWEWVTSLLVLIAELRKRGYDRHFRAGQQMGLFILSRSRIHGLQRGQPRLIFNLSGARGMTVAYYKFPDVDIQLDLERVEITPELDNLLNRLLAQPIS